MTAEPHRWWERASCKGKLHLFFPPTPAEAPALVRQALRYCVVCPVLAECAEAGRHEDSGVWGGVYKYRGKEDEPMRLVPCRICGVVFPSAFQTVTCSAECAKERRRDVERASHERRRRLRLNLPDTRSA